MHPDQSKNIIEHDETSLGGGMVVSHILSSVHAVILIYLEELAFYLVQLDEFGVSNEKIYADLIQAFSELISNVEYKQENINKTISTIYEDLYNTKKFYTTLCKKNDVAPSYLKSTIKISKTYNVADLITQGQKFSVKIANALDDNQKKMLEIMLILLKSICIYIVELQGYKINFEEANKAFITMLSVMNFHALNTKILEEIIQKYTKLDYVLMLKVFDARKAAFGDLAVTEVSTSTRPGKAILVCGSNLKELEMILEATKDRGIDIYTHNRMIEAHVFPKFREYKHLIGYYGKGIQYFLSDFSFQGAIFLTKLSFHKIEQLYRGRVFTTDTIAEAGVNIIKNYDFEPLIQSALSATGFTEVVEQESIELGIDEKSFMQKVNEVADKIDKKKIKYVFFVGVPNRTEVQKKYMDNFLDLLGDDCFAISFMPAKKRENIFFASLAYTTPLVYLAMNVFMDRKSNEKAKLVVFYTRCEPHTIPSVYNMKDMGIDEIYFTDCLPSFMTPASAEKIKEMMKLKSYTNPKKDFEDIIRK